jgi:sec-independent protein translocase protein TatA
MGPVGWQEMVIIFVVALVLFGPKKLPELGKTIGKAITEFRRASNDLKATFEREMQSLEREHESLKEITSSYTNEIYDHYNETPHLESGSHPDQGYGYDSPYDYGAYGTEPYDSHTASNPSTVGESASLDAETHSTEHPAENGTHAIPGTVARGTEIASHTEPEAAPAGNGQAEHEPHGTQKS